MTEQDVERFIKSNYDSAKIIVEGFRCEPNIASLKQEIPNFELIKHQLKNFSVRISNNPVFSQMKMKENNRIKGPRKDELLDIVVDMNVETTEENGDYSD